MTVADERADLRITAPQAGAGPRKEKRMKRFLTATLPVGVIHLYWFLVPARDAAFAVLRPVTPRYFHGLLEGPGSSLRAHEAIMSGMNGWAALRRWGTPAWIGDGPYPYPGWFN